MVGGFGVALGRVGAVAVRAPYGFGRRVSGLAGLGVTLVQVGSAAARALPYAVRRVCVWVWVGPHTNLPGVVGCAWGTYGEAKRKT